MGKIFENAMKSMLRKSGYSDNASNEIMKWYKPKLNKATKNWRDRAWMIDFRKTRVIVLEPQSGNEETTLVYSKNFEFQPLSWRVLG